MAKAHPRWASHPAQRTLPNERLSCVALLVVAYATHANFQDGQFYGIRTLQGAWDAQTFWGWGRSCTHGYESLKYHREATSFACSKVRCEVDHFLVN